MINFIRNGDFLEWPFGTPLIANAGGDETMIDGGLSFVSTGASQPAVTISQQEHGVTSSVKQGYPRYYLRALPASAPAQGDSDKAYLSYSFVEELDRAVAQGTYGYFTFWARASTNREIVVRVRRTFGTGGSAANGDTSANFATQSIQLTTAWRKYQVDIRFVEFPGATYGADATIEARIYLQGGSTELGSSVIPWTTASVDISQVSFTLKQADEYPLTRLDGSLGGGTGGGGGGGTVPSSDFNLVDDFGAIAGTDATNSLLTALSVIPSGGSLKIPDGTFLITTLSLSRSNLTIYGPGVLKASVATTTDWITLTGSNINWKDITFDGDDKARRLLVAGAYSEDWTFDHVTFEDARVTDINDPQDGTPDAAEGSATAVGFRGNTGCKNFRFSHCKFRRISYDGTKPYIDGVGRAARGIHFAPFPLATTWEDACTNITIHDCDFENDAADNAKVDADAVCVQNQDYTLIPYVEVTVTDCRCRNWGWRFVKFQSSGGIFTGNKIWSGTTASASVGPTVRSAFAFFGKNFICSKNFIYGGSYERPINVYSDGAYQCENFEISGNVIVVDAAGAASTHGIFLKSARRGVVSNNTINVALQGIRIQGDSRDLTLIGNNIDTNTSAAILLIEEATVGDTWFGVSPANVVIRGTGARTGNRGVWASAGTNISTDMPIGETTLPIVYASGVTGGINSPHRTAHQAAAAQAVTSSTTLVDVTELVRPIKANTKYQFEAYLSYNELGTVAGLRLGVGAPAAPTHFNSHAMVQTSSSAVANGSAAAPGLIVLATVGTVGQKWARVWGTIFNGANAGNLSIQFAQTASDANATQILRGSVLTIKEIPE